MDWKDNREIDIVYFNDIKAGDVFIYENIIHIKINQDQAFDICNNRIMNFHQAEEVEKRRATLVLE